MKILQKILMVCSVILFLLTLAALVLKWGGALSLILFALHSLSLIAFTFITITYKDPDTDSQRLSNLLQQSEAKYEEYKKDTDLTIKKKEEIISAMSKELEGYKKGLL